MTGFNVIGRDEMRDRLKNSGLNPYKKGGTKKIGKFIKSTGVDVVSIFHDLNKRYNTISTTVEWMNWYSDGSFDLFETTICWEHHVFCN